MSHVSQKLERAKNLRRLIIRLHAKVCFANSFSLKMLSEWAFQEDNATKRVYSQNFLITFSEHLCANGIDIKCQNFFQLCFSSCKLRIFSNHFFTAIRNLALQQTQNIFKLFFLLTNQKRLSVVDSEYFLDIFSLTN